MHFVLCPQQVPGPVTGDTCSAGVAAKDFLEIKLDSLAVDAWMDVPTISVKIVCATRR